MDFPAHRPLFAALILAIAGCASASDEQAQKEPVAAPAAAGTAAATDTVDRSANVRQQYAQLTEMQVMAQRCDWLEPIDALALSLTAAERRDRLVADGVATALLDSDLEMGKTKGERYDCKGADAEGMEDAVQLGAWQTRVTWAMRGYALLPGEDRPSWFQGRSPVEQERAALEEAFTGLQSRYPTSIDPALPKLQEEGERMLALACPGNGETCPGTEAGAAEKAYANAWLEHVAAYAAALATAEDKVGSPPTMD